FAKGSIPKLVPKLRRGGTKTPKDLHVVGPHASVLQRALRMGQIVAKRPRCAHHGSGGGSPPSRSRSPPGRKRACAGCRPQPIGLNSACCTGLHSMDLPLDRKRTRLN